MFRGGPHRALPTEVFRSNTVGRVLRASPRLTGEPLPTSVGGDAHIAPPIGVNAPTFCTVSGSGAGAETILNLGHVLLKLYLPTGKEVKKPSGFLRIFGYFLCAQKVPPPEAWTSRFYHQFPPKKTGPLWASATTNPLDKDLNRMDTPIPPPIP